MSEYIEREKLIERIRGTGYADQIKDNLLFIAKMIPAADVRPVVFCKDCKWYQIDELKKDGTADRRYKPSVCVLAEQRRDPNHFCADGKKREES